MSSPLFTPHQAKFYDEIKSFDISFFLYLLLTRDTIASFVVEADPGVSIISSAIFNKSYIRVFVAGGSIGTSYVVSATVTTTAGRVKREELIVQVRRHGSTSPVPTPTQTYVDPAYLAQDYVTGN